MDFNEYGEKYRSVSDIYDGKCIFVTGVSGFLGKIFLEKILYSCPKIAKVYVLIRSTKRVSAEEKFKKMLDCPIFKRLREERPMDFMKIIPIIGDISKPNLGINVQDDILLIENVSMVFHFAATVKFNEPLHIALNLNVQGTKRILDICLRMKKIQVFLYVSTAFSNASRKVIDEAIYPPPVPLSTIDDILKQEALTEEQTEEILDGLPNTYILTKALAENLVAQFCEQEEIPTIIVRPSIVVSCKDEPVKGWIDNWFGASSIVVAIGKGLIRAMFADGNNIIDLIPADYVSNLLIVGAARIQRSKNVVIYNSSTSAVNPITLRELNDIIIKESVKSKFNELPMPGIFFIKSKWIFKIVVFLLEFLPAYLADWLWRIKRKEQTYMEIQSKVGEVRKILHPFTTRTWMMISKNTTTLSESLSSNDRRAFPFDATNIDWQEFIPTYFHGIRRYLIDVKMLSVFK